MSVIDDVGRKLKGRGQKIRGRIRSDRLKGTIDEMKGTVNETIADAKLRTRNDRRNRSW